MIDWYGRTIDYMRISITDRCNLRCKYCMPDGIQLVKHSDCLTYNEILRICSAAVSLGIVKFKITGGEPLARKDCAEFISRLKALQGVVQVTLTTNGLLLAESLDELNIDGINISLDTLDERKYGDITGFYEGAPDKVLKLLTQCVRRGIPTKINTVPLEATFNGLCHVAKLAQEMPVDVRFIELMPIGFAAEMKGISGEKVLSHLKNFWPDLHPTTEKRGNGPARYYTSSNLKGQIGFVNALSGQFCHECNRVRLTSTGVLKPCLCYEDGTDLKAIIRSNQGEEALADAMRFSIGRKPKAHCFLNRESITEKMTMGQIGG